MLLNNILKKSEYSIMSGAQTEYKKPYRIVHKVPFVSIKKSEIKQAPNSNYGMFRCIPGVSGSIIKEDIVYNATEGDFFKGKYPDLLIINSLDLRINSSRTTASYTGHNRSIVKLSSDAVVQLIGQDNYDQVFASLCCVINQELKVKGIFSLLCLNGIDQKKVSTVYTQTYESSRTDLIKEKQRQKLKHNRRNKVRSYVVQQEPKLESVPKKVVIHPDDLKKIEDIKVEDENLSIETESISDKIGKDIKLEIDDTETSYNIDKDITQRESYSNSFPDLKQIVDEDSNISDVGSVGNLSIGSSLILPDLESKAQSILNYIDIHTEFSDHENQVAMSTIVMLDGSTVMVRGNPDLFHLTMPDVLKDLSPTDQKKLMMHQAYLDWKFCLLPDEDGNLPMHLAVLNNDVELLKRQCSILKTRKESIDILARGNLTALQMSILQNYPECTEFLLAQGADIMVRDDESRTALHLAAETGAKHVHAILEHCRNNAREIIIENEDLWKPELENKPDSKIISYLLTQLNMMYDNQGYTPLMLASNVGNAAAVELLVSAAPSTVNMAMPTCGNTALYLAAGAACTEAANRGDKTKVPENYKRTIEILISHGADPSIENSSGSNVNSLLTEYQDTTLSCIIANKLSAFNGFRFKKRDAYGVKKCDTYMLVKDDNGAINVREVKKPKDYIKVKKTTDTNEDNTNLDRKNNASNSKVFLTPRGNNNKNTSSNESDKPVILKNLPVITKLVSFGKEKPVLVRSISPKEDVANKGLKTQITAKTNILNFNMPPLVPIGSKGNVPKYLKILPKPETEKPKIDLSPKTVITPKEPPKIVVPTKKKPIILRHAAIKRPKHDNDISGPSSSKIPKT